MVNTNELKEIKKKRFFDWYWNASIRRIYVDLEKRFNGKQIRKQYGGKRLLNIQETNNYISRLICNGKYHPFCITRFGAVELNMVRKIMAPCCRYNIKNSALRTFCNNAGFFPEELNYAEKYVMELLPLLKEIDLLGKWDLPMEEYMIKKFCSDQIKLTDLGCLEPWNWSEPWSKALERKKILIIHPYKDTILEQYKRRKVLFNREVLPEVELICIKAVQTIAGEKDERFQTWFEAFNYLYNEAMATDFDVALIGCGSYGMPLALKLKQAGKCTIHLGGGLQLLFGIKGKRWDDSNLYNEHWVRPKEDETPQNNKSIENGCYW